MKRHVKGWVVVVNDKRPHGFRTRREAVTYMGGERPSSEVRRGPYRATLTWIEQTPMPRKS